MDKALIFRSKVSFCCRTRILKTWVVKGSVMEAACVVSASLLDHHAEAKRAPGPKDRRNIMTTSLILLVP